MHRWPILIRSPDASPIEKRTSPPKDSRKRGKSFVLTPQNSPPSGSSRPEPDPVRARGVPQQAMPTIASAGAELVATNAQQTSDNIHMHTQQRRRTSAAENSLAQLRTSTYRESRSNSITEQGPRYRTFSPGDGSHKRSEIPQFQDANNHNRTTTTNINMVIPSYSKSLSPSTNGSSPDALGLLEQLDSEASSGGRSFTAGMVRPKLSRSPSAPSVPQAPVVATVPQFPPELLPLLDGEHHTDELCVRFAVGWPVLKRWLVAAGGGETEDDFGAVSIIYR